MNIILPLFPELDYVLLTEALHEYRFPRKAISDLVKRGKLIRLKKGVYIQKGPGISPVSKEVLASMLYGPSYISYESALSYYGLIPEVVHEVMSATVGKSKSVKTPLGVFRYIHIQNNYYSFGYQRAALDDNRSYPIALPEKAICDRVLREKGRFFLKDMENFLFENIRIEPEAFRSLDTAVFEEAAERGKRNSLRILFSFKKKVSAV